MKVCGATGPLFVRTLFAEVRRSINSRILWRFGGLSTQESCRDFLWPKKVRLFLQ